MILDAHNDLLEALSVDTDYEGFLVSVTSPREFPLTYQNGFKGTVNAAFYLRNFEQILDMIFFNLAFMQVVFHYSIVHN